MAHPENVEALAELLFRVEHVDLGVAPPFEMLPAHRKDVYRRRARMLSSRGVLVARAVAADLRRALALDEKAMSDDELRARLESIGRGDEP